MKQQTKSLRFVVGLLAIAGLLAMAGVRGVAGERSEVVSAGAKPDCCTATLASMASQPFAIAQIDSSGKNSPTPGEWCWTFQRYVANLKDHGINYTDGACAELGPADDPVNRDAAIPTLDTPIKTYRLSIHVFRENDGSNPAASQADVDAAVARLNADYATWRIQFIYETNFINSTRYRTLRSNEETGMKRAYANSPGTKLNVYVVNTGGGNWGTFPWDPDSLGLQGGIVMHDAAFVAARAVFTHEAGHCLGLWHTFHGVTEVPQCGVCYEPVGRTAEEGDVTGDRCSDTNPTTNSGFCGDPAGTDPCSGNPWVSTPFNNYMGYALSCAVEFTPHQAGRMHAWTTDNLTGWLNLPAAPAAPGKPTLTRLSGGQVLVTWADNSPDEDGFRVQREKKSGPNWINTLIIATLGANTTSYTDAPGSGTFRYRVQAFNGVGGSAWSAWAQIKN